MYTGEHTQELHSSERDGIIWPLRRATFTSSLFLAVYTISLLSVACIRLTNRPHVRKNMPGCVVFFMSFFFCFSRLKGLTMATRAQRKEKKTKN